MTKKSINVAVVDDHPLIAEAYIRTLEDYFFESQEYDLKVSLFHDMQSFIDKTKETNFISNIHLIFLDIKMPPTKDGKYLSGEDLGIKIKNELISAKLIVATTYNDNYRIHSLLKSLNPDGFLIKNDLTPEELKIAITSVLNEPPYYSKTVLKLIRKQMSHDYILDSLDRKLLHELSSGTKMVALPNILPLSIAGIEKRKRNLKILFNVENFGDRELIKIAKEKGFI